VSCEILIIIPHLGPGGTQKVAALVASEWAEQGRTVALATLWAREDFHALKPGVTRLHLGFDDVPELARRGVLYRLCGSVLKRIARLETWLFAKLWHRDAKRFEKQYGRVRAVLGDVSTIRDLASAISLLHPRRMWLADRHAGFVARVRAVDAIRIGRIKKALLELQPNVVVSFLSKANVMTLVAADGTGKAVVVCERNDIERQGLEEPWETLRTRLYPLAKLVTANSEGTVNSLSRLVPRHKLRLLPNPVTLPNLPDYRVRQNRFVSASRFEPHKAIDVIIRAFGKAVRSCPDWELHLLGDGSSDAGLKALTKKLGLDRRVHFHGFVNDIEDHLCKAKAFVLASRYEGVPNAMLEAMACALPVVASNASPGPLQFIVHGKTGLVFEVDDTEQLASALVQIAREESNSRQMGEAARLRMERQVYEGFLDAWNQAFATGGILGFGPAPTGEP
jgi:glycosyltransferase involved in cell wall biosynthesis